MAVVGKLEVLTMVNTAGLESGFAKSAKAMKHFGNQAKGAGGAMGWISRGNISLQGIGKSFFGAALGANLATGAIFGVVRAIKETVKWSIRFVDEQMRWVDATSKVAQSLGMTGREFAGFEHSAEMCGMATGEFEAAMRKMQDTLGEALMGTESAQKGFARLGLSVEDLRPMDNAERLYAIADAIEKVGWSAETAAATADIFGKKGSVMAQFFEGGSAGIRAFVTDNEELGRSFTEVEGVVVQEATDSLSRLWKSFKGIGTTIAIKVAPALKVMGDWMTDIITKSDFLKNVGSAAWWAIEKASRITLYVTNALHQIFTGATWIAMEFFNAVIQGFKKLVNLTSNIPDLIKPQWLENFEAGVDKVAGKMETATKWMKGKFLESGRMDWTTQFDKDRDAMLEAADKTAEKRKELLKVTAAVVPEGPTAAAKMKGVGRDLTPAAALRGTAEEYSAIYKARRAMQGAADPALKVQQDQLQEAKKQGKDIADIARNTRGGFQLAAAGIA